VKAWSIGTPLLQAIENDRQKRAMPALLKMPPISGKFSLNLSQRYAYVRLLQREDEAVEGRAHQPQHRPPPVHRKVRHRQQHAGQQRQFDLHARIHLREHRDHEDGQDADRDRNGNHHEGRIAQRALDLLPHVALEFELREQPRENLIQPARAFADADHADVIVIEEFRMVRHRRRQLEALVEVFAQLAQQRGQLRIAGRLLHAGQRLHHRQAGAHHRAELPREQQQLGRCQRAAAAQAAQP